MHNKHYSTINFQTGIYALVVHHHPEKALIIATLIDTKHNETQIREYISSLDPSPLLHECLITTMHHLYSKTTERQVILGQYKGKELPKLTPEQWREGNDSSSEAPDEEDE